MVENILRHLDYIPNRQQSLVIEALARFCAPLVAKTPPEGASTDPAFILAGYAGTGKSSLTGALVAALDEMQVPAVLLAPTGRAAKVFGAYARHTAFTIHRHIYRHSLDGGFPGLRENRHDNTLFIVDEASMISGEPSPNGNSLLEDLIQYIFAGVGNRLILLGDTAQLPPVGSESSPAMDPDVLRTFGLKVSRAMLTATVRQDANSGILLNATALRRAMAEGNISLIPKIIIGQHSDTSIVLPEELPEEIETAYRRDGIENTLLITRTNARATAFNKAIREQVLYLDSVISPGEQILIGKNNYFWPRKVKGLDFIANGDIAVVSRVYGYEKKYGLSFADVEITLPDFDTALDCKIVLDTLWSDTPALSYEQLTRLYNELLADDSIHNSYDYQARARTVASNPYWNALQVKYAYCVTCHKAQGGQWDNVFVDMGYIHPDSAGLELYRWLYTAITRARRRLTVIDTES